MRLGRSVYKAEDNSEDVAVARVAVHPMYRSVFTGHDVAVVTLARRVVFTAAVQPTCLSADPSDLSGATAVVAGWGTTKESKKAPPVVFCFFFFLSAFNVPWFPFYGIIRKPDICAK